MCNGCENVKEVLRNVLTKSAVPESTKDEMEPILGKKIMIYVTGNFKDFERQKESGSTAMNYKAENENEEIHQKMMEVKPLLET